MMNVTFNVDSLDELIEEMKNTIERLGGELSPHIEKEKVTPLEENPFTPELDPVETFSGENAAGPTDLGLDTEKEKTSTVTVDKQGLPWDVRIHSSGKGFLKSSTRKDCWKYKKGLQADFIEEVEAELTLVMAAGTPTAAPANAAGTTELRPLTPENWNALLRWVQGGHSPTLCQPLAAGVLVSATEIKYEAGEEAAYLEITKNIDKLNQIISDFTGQDGVAMEITCASAPVEENLETIDNFPALMKFIKSNDIPKEAVDATCQGHGLPALKNVAARPDLIPAIALDLVDLI